MEKTFFKNLNWWQKLIVINIFIALAALCGIVAITGKAAWVFICIYFILTGWSIKFIPKTDDDE